MEDSFEETCESFAEVAAMNGQVLGALYDPYRGCPGTFLKRKTMDRPIPLHPVSVPVEVQDNSLDFDMDIDGVVVELNKLDCLKAGLHWLFMPKRVLTGHANHWPMLKKHIPLTQMPGKIITEWSHVHGSTLGYVDGGFRLNFTLVPSDPKRASGSLGSVAVARVKTMGFQDDLAAAFQAKLAGLSYEEKGRASIQKNTLHDTSKFEVLPQGLLDEAIEDVLLPDGLKVLLTLTRLGDKNPWDLQVTDLVYRVSDVNVLSVHVAVCVSDSQDEVDLLWSRYGVHRVSGGKDNVYTAYSLHEAANMQTHVFLVSEGCNLNFVQLYVDGPHRHQSPFFKHPVSSALLSLGLLKAEVSRATYRKARAYLAHFRDLASKI